MESTRNDVAGVWHYRQPTTARPADFLSFFFFYHQESVNEESSDNKRNTTLWMRWMFVVTNHNPFKGKNRPKTVEWIFDCCQSKKREGNKRKKNREHTRSIDIKRRRSWWTLLVSLRSWSWRCSSSESRLFKVKTTKGSNGILLSTKPCDQGPIKVSALRLYKTNAIRNLSWPKVNKKIHMKGDIFFLWVILCLRWVCVNENDKKNRYQFF